jgi:hypothetical protein
MPVTYSKANWSPPDSTKRPLMKRFGSIEGRNSSNKNKTNHDETTILLDRTTTAAATAAAATTPPTAAADDNVVDGNGRPSINRVNVVPQSKQKTLLEELTEDLIMTEEKGDNHHTTNHCCIEATTRSSSSSSSSSSFQGIDWNVGDDDGRSCDVDKDRDDDDDDHEGIESDDGAGNDDDGDDDDKDNSNVNEREPIDTNNNDSVDEEALFMDDASSASFDDSVKNDVDSDDDDDDMDSKEKKGVLKKKKKDVQTQQQKKKPLQDESPKSAISTPRRSVRDRNPRARLIENEDSVHRSVRNGGSPASSPDEEQHKLDTTASKNNGEESATAITVDVEKILHATDIIFEGIEDKHTATVKTIITALKDRFSCKISKKLKKQIIDRLKGLINKTIVPHGQEEEEEEMDETNEDNDSSMVSEQGEQSDTDASDYDDDKDDIDKSTNKKRTKSTKKGRTRKDKTRSSSTTKPKSGGSSSKVPNARKVARAARMVEAQRLRKKRMEELRIRNEEMQLNQTKEDQERQDAISAKFETNTEELRLKRLEDRLDLLQRLDEKRIRVVAPQMIMTMRHEEECKLEPTTDDAKSDVKPRCDESESDGDESSSSEEEDLEIIGMKTIFKKPLKPLHNQLPSKGLSVLDELRSPTKNRKKTSHNTKAIVQSGLPPAGGRIVSIGSSSSSVAGTMMLSPGRSMGARFALRNALKQKQRTAGNRWLARELGYKTEEDHLKDCKNVADQKRELVLKLEQERLKANERKQLRERLLLQDHTIAHEDHEDEYGGDGGTGETNSHDDDDDDASYPGEDGDDEEEDEEMKMAQEIEETEKEKESKTKLGSSQNDSPEDPVHQNSDGVNSSKNVIHDSDDDDDEEGNGIWKAWETQPSEISKRTDNNSVEKSISRVHNDSTAFVHQSEQVQPPLTLTKPDLRDGLLQAQSSAPQSQDIAHLPLDTHQLDECLGVSQVAFDQSDSSKNLPPADDSVVTPDGAQEDLVFGNDDSDNEELQFTDEKDNDDEDAEPVKDPNRPRNAGWQAMLKKEAEKLRKLKKRKGGLVEEEAEEEEEEEVAGLEDFGFSITKKKNDDDDDDNEPDELDEDDLEHVVDDVSDNEGDEDAGRIARKRQEQKEEKERHKEILRRMREGYDGRRGGIAGGGAGARGMHRFDQLVAADNREDAKRLGLLNEDELDSEDEENGEEKKEDAEEDEAALLDKMLKDRFMHRSSVELEEENFSDDEDDELEVAVDTGKYNKK